MIIRSVIGAAATLLFAVGVPFGANAQVVPGPATPATVPSQLYIPLRDAFLQTLRNGANVNTQFDYASALQKAQAGDIAGAQRAAAQAMLASPSLTPQLQQQLQAAVSHPLTSLPPPALNAPTPITIAPGPGVPQAVSQPPDETLNAITFARSEIDMAELRVGHPVEDARTSYVDATAAYQRNDLNTALTSARKAADEALDAYAKGPNP